MKDKTLTSINDEMNYDSLVKAISQTHEQTQLQATQAVNLALTLRNWLVGYYIFEYQQNGNDRAKYGEQLLDKLSKDLQKNLGKGLTKRTLEMYRQFYISYPIAKSVISQFNLNLSLPSTVEITAFEWQDEEYFAKLLKKLSWTHFIELMRIDDHSKSAFYEIQTLQSTWSVRELKRQLDSLLYERVGLSRDKERCFEVGRNGRDFHQAFGNHPRPLRFRVFGTERRRALQRNRFGKSPD